MLTSFLIDFLFISPIDDMLTSFLIDFLFISPSDDMLTNSSKFTTTMQSSGYHTIITLTIITLTIITLFPPKKTTCYQFSD